MPGEVHDSTVLFDQEAWPWSADDPWSNLVKNPRRNSFRLIFLWKRGFNKRWDDKKGVRHTIYCNYLFINYSECGVFFGWFFWMLTLKLGELFPCWGFLFVSTGWFNHHLIVESTFWCRTVQSHGGTWVMTWTLLLFFFGQVHSERVPCKFWNCLKFSSSISRFEKTCMMYSLRIYTWDQGRDIHIHTFIYIYISMHAFACIHWYIYIHFLCQL